jgi:hypothetical protein
MGFTASKLEGKRVDGYIALMLCMKNPVEVDTSVCGYREIIHAMQPYYRDLFVEGQDRSYPEKWTRPYYAPIRTLYTRALTNFAWCPRNAERLDLAIYISEELLRLNHDGNTGIRDLRTRL